VVPRNPIDAVARLHRPKRTPTALTATEANAVRADITAWEHERGTSGRKPETASSDRSSRSCSARPHGSERSLRSAIATRPDNHPAALRICGTMISQRAIGTFRQEHPKTGHVNPPTAELLDHAFGPESSDEPPLDAGF